MHKYSKLIQEQKAEVQELKSIIHSITREKIVSDKRIKGALLTGSVARGDARIGPLGIMIDLGLVLENKNDINLDELFGKDEEPYRPYHCITIRKKIGLAIEIIEEKELYKIREKPESVIFAKNESIILDDKANILKKWKDEYFFINKEQIKQRALNNYFRFCYLTGRYRFEKWTYREAWIQVAQNFNEASECYCNFLYCINAMFIPRNDWLTYLTFEMQNTPEKHDFFMNRLYTSELEAESIIRKNEVVESRTLVEKS